MKKPIKLSNEINIFVSLLLFVVIFFQTIIVMYCMRLVDDKKTAWKSAVTRDFESYVSKNITELNVAQKNIVSLEGLVSGLNSKNPDYHTIREKIYSMQEFSTGTLHACVFDKSGNMTEITGNISDAEGDRVKNSFLLYIGKTEEEKNYSPPKEYYDFFGYSHGGYHDIYFISISPVLEHDYSSASNELAGYLCTFSQAETAELFGGYDALSEISITMTSDGGESVVMAGSQKSINSFLTGNWTDKRIPGTDWHTDGSITLSASKFDWSSFLAIFILESLLLVIILLVFSRLLKKRTIVPLKQIGKFMRFFRISDSFKPLDIDGNAELTELAGEINKMVKRNKVLANDIMIKQGKLYEAENLKNEATLYALQNQVNPHYLYNIFELIRSIALVRGVSEIETISVCVSEIFRYNLKKESMALLSDEVDITKRYVSIMQVKYGNSFDVLYDIDPETMEINIMKMIFQPVIENAFGHGYVRRAEKFYVKIKSWLEDGTLYLSFYDNGLGISEERLLEINEKISADVYSGGKGIGVTNLAHRLKMMYGEKYTFNIESEKNKYTEIKISIKLS